MQRAQSRLCKPVIKTRKSTTVAAAKSSSSSSPTVARGRAFSIAVAAKDTNRLHIT
jgi:hypothetical protein